MANKLVKLAVPPNETPAEKKARLAKKRKDAEDKNERERLSREAKEEAKKAELRAVNPAKLFALMVQVEELKKEFPFDLECLLVLEQPKSTWYTGPKEPGVQVVIDKDHHDLSVISEDWEFDIVQEALKEKQAEADRINAERALAKAAKEKLSPEEVAAIRKHG